MNIEIEKFAHRLIHREDLVGKHIIHLKAQGHSVDGFRDLFLLVFGLEVLSKKQLLCCFKLLL